jgi:hypothetical protein
MSDANTEVEIFDPNTGAEIVPAQSGSEVRDAIQALNEGRSSVFSSITGTDFASKLAVLNATTNSKALAENLGKTIAVENIVVQFVKLNDVENPGQFVEAPRTILIDADGTAYHAISKGLFQSVENLIGIAGQPGSWPFPLPVVASREGEGARKYFTLRPDEKAYKAKLAELTAK